MAESRTKQSKAPKDAEAAPDFEAALGELEGLVERMEQGELTLEQSLEHFERGMVLSRLCQSALDEARLKVDQLVAGEGPEDAVPFPLEGEAGGTGHGDGS